MDTRIHKLRSVGEAGPSSGKAHQFPKLPHVLNGRLVFVVVQAVDALAGRTALPSPAMAFAVLLQASALPAVTASHLHLHGKELLVLSVDLAQFCVMAVLAEAKARLTHCAHSQALAVVFLALGVLAVAAFAVGVNDADSQLL